MPLTEDLNPISLVKMYQGCPRDEQNHLPHGVLIERLEELSTEENAVLVMVVNELQRARSIHPRFAADTVHAAAILCEEAGETARAAINYHYQGDGMEPIAVEAIQTAAVAVRLVLELAKHKS